MKRILAFLLMICLLSCILAGCGEPIDPSTPGGDTPGGETPGGDTPGGDTPGGGDPIPPENSMTYQADFRIAGAAADTLAAALQKAGVTLGADDAAKVIYAGEDAATVAAAAKELASGREACYNDYALVCDGTSLALYGAGEYATAQAIEYLIATYVKDGKLTVPKDLSHVNKPALVDIQLGTHGAHELTVVALDKSCHNVAKSLAHELSVLTGREVTASTSRTRRNIILLAENVTNENDYSASYTVSATANDILLTAPTRASLAYAAQDFAATLKDGKTFESGYSADGSFTLVHTDATNTDLFKYCGTWQATDSTLATTMVSYWNAAYVEIDFTGHAITAEFSKATTFKIKMDDAESYSNAYENVTGQITFFAEGDGPHTLRIYANNRNAHMYFAGVSVPATATLSRTASRPHYIQFVGDSISDATNSFSHRVGDVLGWDFSVTALSGIALETDYGYWKHNNGFVGSTGTYTPNSMADLIYKNFGVKTIGMQDAFFKLGIAQEYMTGTERELYANYYYTPELEYNFEAGYTPDAVFIFLGTNDELGKLSDADRFADAYVSFVDEILETYGADTDIWVLQALTSSTNPNNPSHPRFDCVRAAVNALEEKHPDNIHFIDYDVIGTWNVEINYAGGDPTHPTANGYNTLTEKISAILKDHYGE